MKRLALAIVLILPFILLSAWAAEETVDFTGFWVLDQAKSDPFPRSMRATDVGVGGRGGGMGGGMPGGGMGGGMPSGGMGGGMPGGGMGAGMPGGGFGRGRGGPSGAPTPMVMEQHGNEVRVKNGFLVEAFLCDGKQHEKENAIPGSDVKLKEKTKATFKKGRLIVEKITFSPPMPGTGQQMQTLTKRTYSLSQDGKVLTLETTTESTMMSMIQKQVYSRQENSPN